jgi:uncharacterized protein YukE
MAGQIRMTPDQMRARAGEYTTEAGKVQDTISKLMHTLHFRAFAKHQMCGITS